MFHGRSRASATGSSRVRAPDPAPADTHPESTSIMSVDRQTAGAVGGLDEGLCLGRPDREGDAVLELKANADRRVRCDIGDQADALRSRLVIGRRCGAPGGRSYIRQPLLPAWQRRSTPRAFATRRHPMQRVVAGQSRPTSMKGGTVLGGASWHRRWPRRVRVSRHSGVSRPPIKPGPALYSRQPNGPAQHREGHPGPPSHVTPSHGRPFKGR